MADVHYSPDMGAQRRASEASLTPEPAGSFGILANLTGAALSLALLAGIGMWGYELALRDVSGIPVVRAAEGEMRVLPDEPGGQLALHQGLAVNEIAAEGAASGPVDQVTLAPTGTAMRPEDAPQPVVQPAPLPSAESYLAQAVLRDEAPAPVLVSTTQEEAIDPVVAELIAGIEAGTAGSAALAEAAESPAPEPLAPKVAKAEAQAATAAVQLVAADASGPRQSIRPRLRPSTAGLVQKAAFTPSATRAEIDPAAIPSGTRLAQLGAFDTAEVARAEWDRLETRFGDVLADKSRVVQEVTSSGRVFYRLRAMGFRDLNDARRFCSAFKAEGVDCIPVAAR